MVELEAFVELTRNDPYSNKDDLWKMIQLKRSWSKLRRDYFILKCLDIKISTQISFKVEFITLSNHWNHNLFLLANRYLRTMNIACKGKLFLYNKFFLKVFRNTNKKILLFNSFWWNVVIDKCLMTSFFDNFLSFTCQLPAYRILLFTWDDLQYHRMLEVNSLITRVY